MRRLLAPVKYKVFSKLPCKYQFSLVQKFERSKRLNELRKQVTTIKISDGHEWDIYWKDLPIGKGPALAVYVWEIEVLRFDFFGKTGHFHIFTGKKYNQDHGRIFFTSTNIPEQIERCFFELGRNLSSYLSLNCFTQINSLLVKDDEINQAVQTAKETLYTRV